MCFRANATVIVPQTSVFRMDARARKYSRMSDARLWGREGDFSIADAVNCILAIAGTINALGWSTVAIYLGWSARSGQIEDVGSATISRRTRMGEPGTRGRWSRAL